MAVATYTKTGTKASSAATLDKTIFNIEVTSHALLKQAYLTYLANGRSVNAKTQTREDVRGGGRKPWKQKGTGRARAGTIRSPLWRGGAVVFGPTGNESFGKKLPTRTKHHALKQALSLKAQAGVISVIEDVASKDGKTKDMAALLTKIGANRDSLIVVDEKVDTTVRAINNIPDVKLVRATYLNVYEVMNARQIVITKKALEAINAWLGGTK